MNPLLQPIIIDNVFDYLGRFDIDRCQHVCRIWRECALRRPKKFPAIDGCRAIVAKVTLDRIMGPHKWDREAREKMRKLIIKNRMMNKVEFNDSANPLTDKVHYWYIGWASDFCQSPKFKVDNFVQNFLNSDTKCLPTFSLLRYNGRFDRIVKGMIFKYPAVLIRQTSQRDSLKGLIDWDNKTEASISSRKNLSKIYEDRDVHSCFEGFHISRSLSSLKIIITDWSDPESPRPDVNDPEFPIKFMLYLTVRDYSNYDNYDYEIWWFQQQYCLPLFCGELIGNSCGSRPTIHITNPNENKLKPTTSVSIAFAGKEIKSATHVIKRGFDPKQSLEDFKLSLRFPIDTDQVIGFFFTEGQPYVPSQILNELFPSLRLIRFDAYTQDYHPSDLIRNPILHIVWLSA